MSSKAQIFPQKNPHAFCQVHNCRNVAKHFIGKPGAGSLLRLTYMVCDDCLHDIIASAPEGFLPQVDPVSPIDALITVKTMANAGTISKDMFLKAFMPLLDLWANEEDKQDPPPMGTMNIQLDESEIAQIPIQAPPDVPQKEYTCKYCGEKADSPPKLAAHVRRCPMKNGGGTVENGG